MKTILVNVGGEFEVVNIEHIVAYRDHEITTVVHDHKVFCKETAAEISKLIEDAEEENDTFIVPVPDYCYVAVDDDGCVHSVYLDKNDVPDWFLQVKQVALNS